MLVFVYDFGRFVFRHFEITSVALHYLFHIYYQNNVCNVEANV